ncbi:hypothetical protein [Trinickia sp.]|uniref:hypothetical protein n=1 Tax=Trinickia sp. TaxID=2571163 RepID=UPI003F81A7F5
MAKLANAVYEPGAVPPGWKNITNDPAALAKYNLRLSDFKADDLDITRVAYEGVPSAGGHYPISVYRDNTRVEARLTAQI